MAELPQVKKWSGKKILQYQGKVNKFLLRIQEKLTFWRKVRENGNNWLIDHFTVVSLATWPLNGSEAAGDLVLIQTSLLLLCKSTCSYANQLVFTWEKQRGLYQSKVTSSLACIHGQVTKHTTVIGRSTSAIGCLFTNLRQQIKLSIYLSIFQRILHPMIVWFQTVKD